MNRLVIFDVDDTIFYDDIKHTIKETSPGLFSFATYHCAKTFSQSRPIKDMIEKVNRHLDSDDEVYFVTARSGMDDMNLYLKTFHDAGIDIPVDRIIFAGIDRDNNIPTSELKRPVFEQLVFSNIWNKAVIYDDNIWNLNVFKYCCLDADTPCDLWLVTPTQSGKTKLEKVR